LLTCLLLVAVYTVFELKSRSVLITSFLYSPLYRTQLILDLCLSPILCAAGGPGVLAFFFSYE